MAALIHMDSAESTKPPATESPDRYCHQALDISTRQIRLIKLLPDQGGPPSCNIATFELSSAPSFVALSYTWGPPSPQFDILVNGKPLSIRENLFHFFQTYVRTLENDFPWEPMHEYYQWKPMGVAHSSKPAGDLYLWIDQICIDQSSVRERNHQVGMMASIYSGCSETIIWLGNIRDCLDAPLRLGYSSTQDHDWAIVPDVTQALASVSKNEYFTRLWIVQEIVLSSRRRVLCSHPTAGPIWINWDFLCDRAARDPQHLSSTAAKFLLKYHLQEKWMTLIYAITKFSQSHCQNPRDKVYALMGLIKEEQRLTIDYGKSLGQLFLELIVIFYDELVTQRQRANHTIRTGWDPFAEFRTEELVGDLSHSYAEYQDALVDLGKDWGIMSESLVAFLYDVWVRPSYDWHQKFGSERPGPDVYPYIQAMGYFPEAADQNMKLRRKELLPYNVGAERDLGYLEPNEWAPTNHCWWYEIDGTTYEIYGLVSAQSPDDETKKAGYYGRKVRRSLRGWKSRIRRPAWPSRRSSIRSA